ncbi:MAG: rod shape-determining protein RodA [Nostocoides sp.]
MPRDPHQDRPVLRTLARSDWGLFIGALGVSLVGALLVWSATAHDHGTVYLVRHLLNTAIGVGLALGVTRLSHQTLRLLAPVAYAGSLLGLIAVLSPLGSTVNGSRSWIHLPAGFSVQPSEFAKVALCVGLAVVLAERWDRGTAPGHRDVALAWLLAVLPIGLILLQPDLGSALVLGALAFGVIAVGGAPRRWLVGVVVLAVLGITLAVTTPVLSPYQRDRITAFAHPEADPQGIGYQTHQVRIAIGSGGITGEGFRRGRQTQGGFIPFQETDFIFSVAGEELGLLGAGGLLLLLGFLVVRVVTVAARAPDAFGRLVGAGVAVWLTVQVVENVGMNLGLLPVTGLPLPFVSYGGSSMFACWLAIGLVNNTHLATARRP